MEISRITGAARPQSLEPAHRHRSDRRLHRRGTLGCRRCPASKRGCAPAFPEIGFLHPAAMQQPAVAGARAGRRGARPAGAGRLPGHLQPHRSRPSKRGIYQVVVEYTEEAVGRLALRAGASAVPRPRWTTRRSISTVRWRSCANWTKTCASGPAPAPSSMPRSARHSVSAA